MATIIDFSAGLPSAAAIKAAGHDGAILYCSPGREPWMKGKQPPRSYLDELDREGLKFGFVWQYRGGSNKFWDLDTARGFAGGVADAKEAQDYLDRVHCSGHPVIFAVDCDITLTQWNEVAVEYFKGAISVLGKNRVGIYGHSRVIHWAMQDQVVAEVAPGRVLGWQTKSWSRGVRATDYAVAYQHTHGVNGPDGVNIDVNDVWYEAWGWQATSGPQSRAAASITMRPNPAHRGDPTFFPELFTLWEIPYVEFEGWRTRGQGDFDRIIGGVSHHTAGANTPPSLIAFGHSNLRGLLSQLCLTRDGVFHIVGAGIAHHAGRGSWPGWPTNDANRVTIGVEAVNAGDGSQPWPDIQKEMYAKGWAAICWYLGWTAQDVIGHKEWNPIGKIDPNFSMDEQRARIAWWLDNPPFMHRLKEDTTMALDLDKSYRSRYWQDGKQSDYEGNLEDFWLNTDAHAYAARVESAAANRRLSTVEEKLDQILAALGGSTVTEVK